VSFDVLVVCSSAQLSDEARPAIILQLEILSGIATNLTRSEDGFTVLGRRPCGDGGHDDCYARERGSESGEAPGEYFYCHQGVVELWSVDVEIRHVYGEGM